MSVRVTNNTRDVMARVEAALPRGVAKACHHIADTTRPFIPVRTGELRDSEQINVESQGDKVVGRVAYTAGHAAFVEYGTRYMAARGYLRQGLENGGPEAESIIAETVAEATKA